jgi:tetratricopeptide (TPR) repeat protein
LKEALEGWMRAPGPDTFAAIKGRTLLALNYFKQGHYDDAEKLLDEAVRLCHKNRVKNRVTQTAIAFLGWTRFRQKKYELAEETFRKCLTLTEELHPDQFQVFGVKALLGASLAGQKNYPAARPLLEEGYKGMKARADKFLPQYHFFDEAAGWLEQLFEATDNEAEREKWRAERVKHQKAPAPPPSPFSCL